MSNETTENPGGKQAAPAVEEKVKQPAKRSAAAKKTAETKSAAGARTAAKKDEVKTKAAKATAGAKAEAKKPAKQSAPAKGSSAEKAVTAKTARASAGKSSQRKVLFAVSEVAPFISTGGMGQVVSSLPMTLHNITDQLEVRVIAPYYQQIRNQFGSGMTFLGNMEVPLAWRRQYCGVFTAERDGVTYYFLDNEHYFNREECYGSFDDGERFAFFSKAVLSVFDLIDYTPDVIHTHDWQTALIPIYLKTTFADKYPKMKSVFTIHNIEYQGQFPLNALWDVFDLRESDYSVVEYQSCINLVKGAIVSCDKITTVSPSYAEEIKQYGGYGLEPVLLMHEDKLVGILNGIDTELYNPETDPTLAKTYSADTLENKAANKRDLQTLFGLPVAPRAPVLCMVSRLVSHKGLDLLLSIMEDLISDGVQFYLLGTGDYRYELFFNEMAIRHPNHVAVNIAYNPAIVNKIYAGADIMLMPSLSEPCGLSQMIACRYATVPVARATGGIKDTIRDCRSGDGNGYLFTEYDAGEFLSAIRAAIHQYTYYENDWMNLMREGMRTDFRWDLSAKAYAAIYTGLCS